MNQNMSKQYRNIEMKKASQRHAKDKFYSLQDKEEISSCVMQSVCRIYKSKNPLSKQALILWEHRQKFDA